MLRVLGAFAWCAASVQGCVQVDVYPGPRRHGASDGGIAASDARVIAVEAATRQACEQCVAAQCAPEWATCQGDPDCLSCLSDPLGKSCQASLHRHDFRNCACATSTCFDACPSLCPTPASLGVPVLPQVPQDCIQCTGTMCNQEATACVVDPVCLTCVNDAANPKCVENQLWNQTRDCLCGPARACFEECCAARP